ncbi:class I SAM-dependent DNA methyltransferase [Thiospirillum jenense]|uniref:site-specific DNA-methyltransferase (adenine-specific) n=1 Tax=Thiospirillum jenense TaxID=1653858 RepID=A0A839HFL4_9GAMM|nr:DNA methyltransferase [Thiospirillum jenense]MBB1126146.1 class I SAM-dependent DNA methyltransferase [Thiospirillum jenense]
MTPDEFITKWQVSTLKESAASQEHFIDVCRLLNEPTPAEADPTGEWYCFEKGAKKTTGGDGWADVWKRGCFGWEYKSKHKNLKDAFVQLHRYAPALENPPLLIVSDMEQIIIHTAFTGTVLDIYEFALEDLLKPRVRQILKWAFSDSERLRPSLTTAELTEQAARQFGILAHALRERGHHPLQVAHFCQQLLFCLFAEDIDLLPNRLFNKLLNLGYQMPERLPYKLTDLLHLMATGGSFGIEDIDWFNGGLFDSIALLPLERSDIRLLRDLTKLNWAAIEPSIFGTLFERGLDPSQRAQLGAHYTDPASIMRLVEPVVLAPLRAEWTIKRDEIAAVISQITPKKSAATRNKLLSIAQQLLDQMLDRLRDYRVLDPACGSGNFLFLTLRSLKDLEYKILLDAEQFGLKKRPLAVSPANVLGIERNDYAAELARATVWIGELQWMLEHGASLNKNPILKKITVVEHRDAIVDTTGNEPDWPVADVIVSNPPFLGGSKKRSLLGNDYFKALETIYAGRVPAGADLVCYWFEKARTQIELGKVQAAGLVATNSIRGGVNRNVLERIVKTTRIFHAWSDEPWINAGAAVRVSLICFGHYSAPAVLNNQPVDTVIYADLTTGNCAVASDLTAAKTLPENAQTAFQGSQKIGAFDVSGELARAWLLLPNPHGQPNSDVLKPSWNGLDLTRRPRDGWIIDFGTEMVETDAMFYEAPFAHVVKHVKPERMNNHRAIYRRYWWRHGEARIGMRRALKDLPRYIATAHVAKHRLFVFMHSAILPDKMLIVIARADDTTFGILHSRFHELWSLRMGTSLGATPRYTPSTTFETFPFPIGLTPADTNGAIETLENGVLLPLVKMEYKAHALAIANVAYRLNQLRNNWLNPPEWTEHIPEVVSDYPDRIIAKPEYIAQLNQRTLTHLYNQRPAWLNLIHQQLDGAIANAYGWKDYTLDMTDDEVLKRLLELNQVRQR